MNRTEYNEICKSRGYIGLTDEDNTYMLKDAVVCGAVRLFKILFSE